MATEKYRVVVPLNCCKNLVIETKNCTQEYLDSGEIYNIDLNSPEEIPGHITILLETAQTAISRILKGSDLFMLATATGFRIVKLSEIIMFEYTPSKKQWTVLLSNQSTMQLKRNTVAADILNYSSSFFRINNQQIINFDFLVEIIDRKCRLNGQMAAENELKISRTYFREIQRVIRTI